ncbi:glycosyltransferase [Frigidibacter sp. MR17.14]|uniref:glycosyltransferase family 2 protein n=1 Tax=Frigidibacter sp. MR17.14 TaxID=3126509 RepID=UPI0030131CCA
MSHLPKAIRAPYGRIEIEMSEPLPDIDTSGPNGDWNGVHVLARWKGYPVGRCWVHREHAGSKVSGEEIDEILGSDTGYQIATRRLTIETGPMEPATLPSLTMVVCTRNRAKLLERCLQSLVALELGGVVPELLVVDNAPPDASTQDCVAGFPRVRYAREPMPGLDFARNRAIAECRTDYLAYIDDDATVDSGWLAAFAEAVRIHPDAGGFTGLVLPLQLETEAQIRFELAGGFAKGFGQRRYGSDAWGDPIYPAGAGVFGTGANMVFRLDALQAIGGCDDALDTGPPLPGGGDIDLYYRIVRHGFPMVYDGGMLIFHEHRRDMPGLRRQYYTWGLGIMALVEKNLLTDPEARSRNRHLVLWLAKYYLIDLYHSLRGRRAKLPSHILAEIWGAIVGGRGEYRRSQARIARIREEFGQ